MIRKDYIKLYGKKHVVLFDTNRDREDMTISTPKKINAYRYNIRVSTVYTHPHLDRIINEVYVPEYGICFNESGNCFECKDGRMNGATDIENIELSMIDMELILSYLQSRKNLLNIMKDTIIPYKENYGTRKSVE